MPKKVTIVVPTESELLEYAKMLIVNGCYR